MGRDGGPGVDRRTFLVGAALASVGLATTETASGATSEPATVRGMRTLGRTGLRVPDIVPQEFPIAGLPQSLIDAIEFAFDPIQPRGRR